MSLFFDDKQKPRLSENTRFERKYTFYPALLFIPVPPGKNLKKVRKNDKKAKKVKNNV